MELTELLNRAAGGDAEAARDVFPLIYRELHGLAASRRARLPAGATLQTTALVHEAYLRVVARHPLGWESLRHFYFTAARAMRDILVEEARRRLAVRHGGGQTRVPFEEEAWGFEAEPERVLAVDAALTRLEVEDAAGHQLVLLRFYTGLTFPEIARVLNASLRTVERRWRFLRAWLAREIEGAGPGGAG